MRKVVNVREHRVVDRVRIVYQYDGEAGDFLSNPTGASAPHETRVITGRMEFRFDDRDTVELREGDAFTMPAGVPYDVVVLDVPLVAFHEFDPDDEESMREVSAIRFALAGDPARPVKSDGIDLPVRTDHENAKPRRGRPSGKGRP